MTMKKFLLFAVATAAFLFTSCNKESTYHTLGIVYPTQYSSAVIYADQKVDSITFQTTDNFRLDAMNNWILIDDSLRNVKVENYYRLVYVLTLPIRFEANATGEIRQGQVKVSSTGDDDWDQSAYASYTQLPWHNIQRPAPAFSYEDHQIKEAKFELTDSATQECDTLRFTTYENWTLTDGEFAHPAKLSGKPGNQTVLLAIDPNATAEERTATIVLESRGVKTNIFVKQEGKKE